MEGDNIRTFVRKDPKRAGRVERYCGECSRLFNKTRTRDQWLQFKYGITEAQYDVMFQEQNGLCAVCKQPETIKDAPLRVDHDHVTGRVRGLLCHHCNVALGHFKDNPDLLLAAINYLRRPHAQNA